MSRSSSTARGRDVPRLLDDRMIWIEGGAFRMGSEDHYPEERPARRVVVDGFFIDPTLVTNAQFRAFVRATGHVTLAEEAPARHGAGPDMPKAGSLVFNPPDQPVWLDDDRQWWEFRFRADWRRPYGPGSSIKGQDDHPVVHVAHRDAEAYARWAGKELPTEAEWEFAARGGLDEAEFAWGDELTPGGRHMANIWQGEFPFQNLKLDGFERTSPVRVFPPNGYGLHDMIGNVWEWTADGWSEAVIEARSMRAVPRGESDPIPPAGVGPPKKVLKGGSHLCAPNYCRRYRPAARRAGPVNVSASDIGFRCVRRVKARG